MSVGVSQQSPFIPAQAGIQSAIAVSRDFSLGPRFRGDERQTGIRKG
jgi:hypothetical protein